MTKTMLPVLKVSLTHIMCSVSVCQMHKETAEWLNECVLVYFFTKNKSLLKVDFQYCLHLAFLFVRNMFYDSELSSVVIARHEIII